jgi:hypothetical protein
MLYAAIVIHKRRFQAAVFDSERRESCQQPGMGGDISAVATPDQGRQPPFPESQDVERDGDQRLATRVDQDNASREREQRMISGSVLRG